MRKVETVRKPYPGFPLSPHSSGQWKKTIKGRVYYFGSEWREALKRYEELVEVGLSTGPTVAVLIDDFLDSKNAQWESGSIKKGSLLDYRRACVKIKDNFGLATTLDSLTPSHFLSLRNSLESSMAPTTLKRYLVLLRAIFKFAYQMGYVGQPLRYGDALKTPAARLIRKSKLLKTTRIFSPEEIHQLIKEAKGAMKPAIWLAINCGFGNTDVCELQWSDIEGEWLELVRSKTYIARAAYLWPETIIALDRWKSESPTSEWVACGRRGQKLGGEDGNTPIAHMFSGIAEECGISGRGFYALRHTYRTVADGCKDQPAVMLTMGHSDSSISNEYRHGISEDRLVAVADHVRGWLGEPSRSSRVSRLRG